MSLSKRALTSAVMRIDYPESDGKPMAETDLHRQLMNELISQLDYFFQTDPEVYVTGNIFLYYVQGDPHKRVAPDVMFVRGVEKTLRRTYKLWEEGVAPQVVFEISSRQTWGDDLQRKWSLYARLGVQEYYIFDPEYDYLDPPLLAYALKAGELQPVRVRKGRVASRTLGLELVDTGETLRLFDPKTKRFLPTIRELDELRQQAEARARTAEAELTKLRRKVARWQKSRD